MATAQTIRRDGITVEVCDRTRAGPPPEAVADLAARVLVAEGVAPAEVGISFVGDLLMRRLNREHRGIDAVTDVLSFPLEEAGEWEEPAQWSPAGSSHSPNRTEDFALAPPRLLGDVVLCPRQARRQAAAEGTPLGFEVGLLLVHGLLHLLGWEHDERPGVMALRQGELLNDFDWSRLAAP